MVPLIRLVPPDDLLAGPLARLPHGLRPSTMDAHNRLGFQVQSLDRCAPPRASAMPPRYCQMTVGGLYSPNTSRMAPQISPRVA